MKKENKIFFITFFVSGLTYAGLMAAYEYYTESFFDLTKFLFHTFFFGLFMGLVFRFSSKNQQKLKDEADRKRG